LKEERLRFWVSPNDGRTGCDCEACTKLRDTEGATSSMVTLFAKRVADISLGGTLKTISVPLDALPPGDHTYNDLLNYGGALKFRGTVSGMKSNSDGYALAGGADGTVSLPIKAAPGNKIVSLTVKMGFSFFDPALLSARVEWIDDGGETVTLASNLKETEGCLTLSQSLSTSSGTLKITLKSLTTQDYTVLSWFAIKVKVE